MRKLKLILLLFFIVAVILQITKIVEFQGLLVSKRKAITAVENMNYVDVKVVKRQFYFVRLLGGSKSDVVRFVVEGKNFKGETRTIYVYSGWPFKAATIRTP